MHSYDFCIEVYCSQSKIFLRTDLEFINLQIFLLYFSLFWKIYFKFLRFSKIIFTKNHDSIFSNSQYCDSFAWSSLAQRLNVCLTTNLLLGSTADLCECRGWNNQGCLRREEVINDKGAFSHSNVKKHAQGIGFLIANNFV